MSLADAQRRAGEARDVVVGGGDATRWPGLRELVDSRPSGGRLSVEAPARSLDAETLARLRADGVAGLVVQVEAAGPKAVAALGVGDGEAVGRAASALGFEVSYRVCARPRTFPSLLAFAARVAPARVELELVREDWGKAPVELPLAPLEHALSLLDNVVFSGARDARGGYAPPCALPTVWATKPWIWRSVLSPAQGRNETFRRCADCAVADGCRFADPDGLPSEGLAAVDASEVSAWGEGASAAKGGGVAAPAVIRGSVPAAAAVCVAPWTTLEILDPSARAYQCCSEWTRGDRGDLVAAGSIDAVWNGEGYRRARRIMSGRESGTLCEAICPRLYDRALGAERFEIQPGTAAYVANQLALADDIARGRDEATGQPLYVAIAPSTYCNFDCIMCVCGRTPRQDLPDSIYEDLPRLFPTLRALTLLGGEPLANPKTVELVAALDREKYPDASVSLVTNGSLLGRPMLSRLARCQFGSVTVSLNAGTAEAFDRVQRGASLERVLMNVDALLELRRDTRQEFPVVLSFVVQPAAIDTLLEFGELARVRRLPVRLLPLNLGGVSELDFYGDPAQVAHVDAALERFESFARGAIGVDESLREVWLREARGARGALAASARPAR